MKKIVSIILFLVIFFLGTLLRFYQLGSVPNSMDWDEVSWGYSAYSILHTGKDEYGLSYPMSFKAFGDYKQPVYVYAEVLPIQLFGLNAFSVRFPSAFFGSLSIPFVFLLVYELFRRKKYAVFVAFFSMLFFAISPWSIQFSRVAFESTVGLFFVLVGVCLFLVALKKESLWLFIASAIPLAISAYTYHSEKLFTPLFVVGLLFYGRRVFLTKKKLFIAFSITFLFLNLFWLIDARTTARGKSVLFTSQQTQILKHSLAEQMQDENSGEKALSLLHNRRLIYANKFVENYLSHFNPNWLFVQGDLARHHAPDFGLLYIVSLPFIIMGIYFLLTQEQPPSLLLGYWLFLAPISGALVTGAPNAERAVIMLPIWQILEAFGFLQLVKVVARKRLLKSIVFVVIGILYVGNFILYVDQYFLHTNTDYDRYWQYGYQQAVMYARNSNKKVIFANDVEQGYMFYLFYNAIDPQQYLAGGGSNRLREKCYQIEKAYFGNCATQSGDYFVTVYSQNDKQYRLIKQFDFSAGDPAIFIYQVQ